MALWNRDRSNKNSHATVPAPAEPESEPPKEVSIFADNPERKRVPLQQSLKEAENILNGISAPMPNISSTSEKTEEEPCDIAVHPKNSSQRKRCYSLHLRFTPAEYVKFQHRVDESGLSKNAFGLQAVLESKIVIETGKRDAIMALYQELKETKAELGRQGGMLKMVIKPNKDQRALHPEEWDALIQSYETIEKTKKLVEGTIDKINGYFET